MPKTFILDMSELTPSTVARSGIGVPIRVRDHSNRPHKADAEAYLGLSKKLPHYSSREMVEQVKRVNKRLASDDFNGWGIVLSEGWCIIDIDVIDGKTGRVRKERQEAAIDFIKKWGLDRTIRVNRYSQKISPVHGHYYLRIPDELIGDRVGGKVIHEGVALGEMILPGVRYAAAPGYVREHPKVGRTKYRLYQGRKKPSDQLMFSVISKKLWRSLRGQKDSEHLPISGNKKYPEEVLEALRIRCEEKIEDIKGAPKGRRRVYHLLPAWSDMASYISALEAAEKDIEAAAQLKSLEDEMWSNAEETEDCTDDDLNGWKENYKVNMRSFRNRDFIRPEGLSEDVQELIRMQDDVTSFWDRQPAYKALKNIGLRERTDPFAVLLTALMVEASSVDHRVRVKTCQKVKTLRPVPMTIYTVMVGGTGRGKTSTAETVQRARQRNQSSASAVLRSIEDGGILLIDNEVIPRSKGSRIDLQSPESEKLSPTTRNGILDGFTESGPLFQTYKVKGEKKTVLFQGIKRQKCHRAHIWIDEARTYLPGLGGKGNSENSDRLISFLNSAFLGGDIGHDTGRDRFKVLSGQYTLTALLGIQDDVLENFEDTYSSGFFGRCSIVCLSHDPIESEMVHQRAYIAAEKTNGYFHMNPSQRDELVRTKFEKLYPSYLPPAIDILHPGWDGFSEIERVQNAIERKYSKNIGKVKKSSADVYGTPLSEKNGKILSSAVCSPDSIRDPLVIFTLGENVSKEIMRVATVSLMDSSHEDSLSQDHADILREWRHMKRINFDETGEQSLLSDMVSHGLMRMEILTTALALLCAPQDKKLSKAIDRALKRTSPSEDVVIEIPDNYWEDVKIFSRFLGLKYRTHRAQQKGRALRDKANKNWKSGEDEAYREHSKSRKLKQLDKSTSNNRMVDDLVSYMERLWSENSVGVSIDGEKRWAYPVAKLSNYYRQKNNRQSKNQGVPPVPWKEYKTSEDFTSRCQIITYKGTGYVVILHT